MYLITVYKFINPPVKIKTVASVLNPVHSSEMMLFTCNVL